MSILVRTSIFIGMRQPFRMVPKAKSCGCIPEVDNIISL